MIMPVTRITFWKIINTKYNKMKSNKMRSILLVIICLGIFTNTNLLAGDPPPIDLSGRWFWEGRGIDTNNDGMAAL